MEFQVGDLGFRRSKSCNGRARKSSFYQRVDFCIFGDISGAPASTPGAGPANADSRWSGLAASRRGTRSHQVFPE